MRMAVSRLRSCERSFWQEITMPVGRCVMRTAESAVLTPCPPGPDARKTSTRSSSSRTLTSTSSTSGTTATEAKLVWRRLEASKGEIRTRRCTPVSPRRYPKAYSPDTSTVADLMPASSPGSRSTTSALKPARSHQRRYMRMSICAQSCDSVPPAPGWMERMAAFASCGPDSITFSSNSSRSRCSLAMPSRISASTLSSPASAASSSSTARSEAWPPSSVTRATTRASSLRSRISSCARRLSSQKAGDAISASSAASRVSLAGRSKVPPELVDPPGQGGDVALEVAQHLRAPRGDGAGPVPRPRQRGRRHRQREQPEPVAEPREECPAGAQRDLLGHDAALEELQAAHDEAIGRDEGGDAGVGRAHDAHAMLHRAERVHREVLLGPARASEPCVVRHVHHQPRAVPHELPEEIGKDALVTDYDTERSRRSVEDHGV